MSRWVIEALDHGARTEAEHVRALKLIYARELLTTETCGGEVVAGIARIHDTIAVRPVADIVAHATPFVWKNLERVFHAAAVTSPEVPRLARYFLASLFDAFFDWLPDGTSISLAGNDAEYYVFPQLGVQIPPMTTPFHLRRLGDRSLELTYGLERRRIDLDAPGPYSIPSLTIPGYPDKRLISVRTSMLFESNYMGKLAPMDHPVDALAAMIGQSLSLIEAVDPVLALRLIPFLRWFVPLTSPDPQTHNSFSVSFLPGVLFLSDAYRDSRLAEAIVHEFHHNELYIVQETEQLFTSSDVDLYYSPWRPDPRPINGLLHALHVFSGVAEFLARAERLSAHREWDNRRAIVRQLQLGLLQVDRHRLTGRGRELIVSVEQGVADYAREFGPLGAELPTQLRQHLAQWRAAHPHLTNQIRLPNHANLD